MLLCYLNIYESRDKLKKKIIKAKGLCKISQGLFVLVISQTWLHRYSAPDLHTGGLCMW